jgi:hypothetical protein
MTVVFIAGSPVQVHSDTERMFTGIHRSMGLRDHLARPVGTTEVFTTGSAIHVPCDTERMFTGIQSLIPFHGVSPDLLVPLASP